MGPSVRVLEIGGGNGFQADIMASWGCRVESIDIVCIPPDSGRYFPVKQYNGRNIPYSRESFEVVFSSCVLEHLRPTDLRYFLGEVRRVLRPGGVAVHVLPTASWRFWTNIYCYWDTVKYILDSVVGRRPHLSGTQEGATLERAIDGHGFLYVMNRIIFTPPHGEYSNGITELYYFSRRRWRRVFEKNGFDVKSTFCPGLFYVGEGRFSHPPEETSRNLARLLGSSARVFIMYPHI